MEIIEREKIRKLIFHFKSGKYSVLEFQERLEPLFNEYPFINKVTERQFREFINDLELVLYTLRPEKQWKAAKKIADDVYNFLKLNE